MSKKGRCWYGGGPGREGQGGYALIRTLCAGICNTDLELLKGYYSFRGTPGHEFVGEVAESDSQKLQGRRVVGEIDLACGACPWCAGGMERHCPNRKVLGIVMQPGAFSEYFLLPERILHIVPDGVPTECAVFTEPLAAACEILDQVTIPPGAPVAVLGDGKLGLLAAQVLQNHRAEVHMFGRHREKLRIAEAAGIRAESRRGRLPSQAFDWVVEATGSSDGLSDAAGMVRPRGTIILKSTVHGLVSVDTSRLVADEITLVGSRCGRFEPALRLLRDGKVRVADMISDRLPLADAPRAFNLASRGALKVLLQP